MAKPGRPIFGERRRETGNLRVSCVILGNEPGISVLVEIRRETRNFRVSCVVLGNEPGISVLVEVRERPGISVSLERFLETSREYPYS